VVWMSAQCADAGWPRLLVRPEGRHQRCSPAPRRRRTASWVGYTTLQAVSGGDFARRRGWTQIRNGSRHKAKCKERRWVDVPPPVPLKVCTCRQSKGYLCSSSAGLSSCLRLGTRHQTVKVAITKERKRRRWNWRDESQPSRILAGRAKLARPESAEAHTAASDDRERRGLGWSETSTVAARRSQQTQNSRGLGHRHGSRLH
jgi:hypothetical protein